MERVNEDGEEAVERPETASVTDRPGDDKSKGISYAWTGEHKECMRS